MPTIDSRGFAQAPGTTTSGIQEAVNAVPSQGGDVFVESSPAFPITTGIVLPTDRPVWLHGAGKESTVITCADVNVDMLRIRGNYQKVSDMCFRGPGLVGGGRNIVIGRTTAETTGAILIGAVLEDVRVDLSAGSGIHLLGANSAGCDANSISILSRMTGVTVTTNKAGALLYADAGNTTWDFASCSFRRAIGYHLFLNQVEGFHFNGGSIEEPLADNADFTAWVLESSCHIMSFDGVWLEATGLAVQTKPCFVLNNGGNFGHVYSNLTLRRSNATPIHDSNFMTIGGNAGNDYDITVVNPYLIVNTPVGVAADVNISAQCSGPITFIGGIVRNTAGGYERPMKITDSSSSAVVLSAGGIAGAAFGAASAIPRFTTALRPTANLVKGSHGYDTTLNKPIWWNGSVWKDGADATV